MYVCYCLVLRDNNVIDIPVQMARYRDILAENYKQKMADSNKTLSFEIYLGIFHVG